MDKAASVMAATVERLEAVTVRLLLAAFNTSRAADEEPLARVRAEAVDKERLV